MASSALWGTAMVSTYEFLKRTCQISPEEEARRAAQEQGQVVVV
jgi:hypothetical protein